MKIIDLLREECVAANLQFSDKAAALRGVVEISKNNPALKGVDEKTILAALQEREQLGTTGFGDGIAIPHCRLKSVSEFVVGIITVASGVDFEAIDDKKVSLIIFIIGPENELNEHIRLLSDISQTLLIPGALKELLAAKTSQSLRESFLRHTRAEVETRTQGAKSLIHVFVQEDRIFRTILQILTAIDSRSIVVVGAENTGAYLAKMPLFAAFWRDQAQSFSRIIIMLIDKKLVNETVRRIESITGNLNKRTGVMVTVQDISYSAGTLEVQT